MSPASPDDGKLASCLAGMARTGCFFQFNLLRVSMPGAVLRSLLPTAVMLIMTWGLYRGRRLAAWAFIIVGLGESCIAMLYYFVAPLSHAPQGLRSLLLHGAIPASRSARTRGVCGEAARRSSSPWPSASRRIWASDCCAPAISGLRRHGMA